MKKYNPFPIVLFVVLFVFNLKLYAQKEAYFAVQKIIKISTFEPVWNSSSRDFSSDGAREELFSNGNTQFTYTINEGAVNGLVKEHYENGNRKLEGTYLNNVKNGVHKTYYIDGKIESVSEFYKGNLKEASIFYNNGRVKKRPL